MILQSHATTFFVVAIGVAIFSTEAIPSCLAFTTSVRPGRLGNNMLTLEQKKSNTKIHHVQKITMQKREDNDHADTLKPKPVEISNHRENNRRQSLSRLAKGVLLGAVTSSFILTNKDEISTAANAYERAYPTELVEPELGSIQDGRQRRIEQIREQEAGRISRLELGPGYKPLSSVLWGGALWLLTGSRSNPLVTPLANIMYDKNNEAWLKDRNEGLFADIPPPLFALLAGVFFAFGFALDTLLVTVTEGDRNVVLQLAGVTLIAGGALELGRIASGEKKQTRAESDRMDLLQREFEEFAQSRLKPGGNCHRNEVVKAFRRYFGKYRVADNEKYPLADLEIERLLRAWSRQQPGDSISMSSAGFYTGIQINTDADVFVMR